jgi:hypothetical protein
MAKAIIQQRYTSSGSVEFFNRETNDVVMRLNEDGTVESPSLTTGDDDETVTIYKKTVTLTNAQIKALPSTDVEIVPAPGTGKVIQYVSVRASIDASAGDYTNVHADANFFLQYVGGTAFTLAAEDFWYHPGGPALSGYFQSDESVGPGLYNLSDYENRAIATNANNSGQGDFTGGNAANSLTITVWYGVMDI